MRLLLTNELLPVIFEGLVSLSEFLASTSVLFDPEDVSAHLEQKIKSVVQMNTF